MLLRPLVPEDAPYMLEWMKDPQVNRFFRFDKNSVTLESCKKFIQNSFTEKQRHYAITDDGEYMGTISLKNISKDNKSAEYAIALRRTSQGKGLGTKASRALLSIAFNELNLNKVYLDVLSDNTIAKGLYEKVGFKKEGTLKQHIFIDNQPRDLDLYGILKEDYERM